MSAMASQITGVSIVYSSVYSGADQRKHQNSASLAFVRGIHRWPVKRASNAENASIWWRHHVPVPWIVVVKTCVAVSDDKTGIMTTPVLQWIHLYDIELTGSFPSVYVTKVHSEDDTPTFIIRRVLTGSCGKVPVSFTQFPPDGVLWSAANEWYAKRTVKIGSINTWWCSCT